MSYLIPFILRDEQRQIKSEIEVLPASVIYNGTSRLGETLAIYHPSLCRSVNMQDLPESLMDAVRDKVNDR